MGLYFADEYSLLHFASGVIAQFLGLSFWQWFFLHIIFEIVENSDMGLKMSKKLSFILPGVKYEKDSLLNMVGDQFFAVLGWLASFYLQKLGKKYDWVGYYHKHNHFS